MAIGLPNSSLLPPPPFPRLQARALSDQLLRALRGFTLAPAAAAAHVAAVAQLSGQHGGSAASAWAAELLGGAEKVGWCCGVFLGVAPRLPFRAEACAC